MSCFGPTEYLDYKKDPKAFVRLKVYEGLIEGRLALEMLKAGLLREASIKAFQAVRAVTSAIIVKNFDRVVNLRGGKDKYWYETEGYTAPARGMVTISYDLLDLGVDAFHPIRTALTLEGFYRWGFDPDLSFYCREEDVVHDIREVLEWITTVDKYFKEEWDERLEKARKELREELEKVREE